MKTNKNFQNQKNLNSLLNGSNKENIELKFDKHKNCSSPNKILPTTKKLSTPSPNSLVGIKDNENQEKNLLLEAGASLSREFLIDFDIE